MGAGNQPQTRKTPRVTRSPTPSDQDSFPEPSWPKQTLDELILVTFAGRMIDSDNHPGLLRLIGAKQSLS